MLTSIAALAALDAATTTGMVTAAAFALRCRRRLLVDDKTQLPNRLALQHAFRRITRRRDRWVGVLLADLNGFKQINDTHGHAFGNAVLIEFATRLRNATAATGDLAVRLHGDEFAVLLGRVDNPQDAEHRAAQLAETLAAPMVIDGRHLTATASIGAAAATLPASLPALLGRADEHMYAVKRRHHANLPPLPVVPASPARRPNRPVPRGLTALSVATHGNRGETA